MSKLILILLWPLTSTAAQQEILVKAFLLKACSAETRKCIEIESAKATGSILGNLMTLDDPKIVLFPQDQPDDKTFLLSRFTYINFSTNQLVIQQLGGKKNVEKSIDLNTMAITTY